MARRYKTPPIIEAICEFKFVPHIKWNDSFVDQIFKKIEKKFPKKKQTTTFEVEVPGQESVTQIKSSLRYQFYSEDENCLIQVSPNLLVVNKLKPYGVWKDFQALIDQALDAYCEIVSPEEISRIGLRYINRVEFRKKMVELEEYFDFRPCLSLNLPKDYSSFIVGAVFPYESGRDQLRINLGSGVSETPDTLAITLDLDYFMVKSGKIALSEVHKWTEVAHYNIEKGFEGCITDNLRVLFEEDKQ